GDRVDGGRVFAVPEVDREPNHQADQQSMQIAEFCGDTLRRVRGDQLLGGYRPQHFRGVRVTLGEYHRRIGGGRHRSDGRLRAGRRQGLIDQGILQVEEPSPCAQPGAADQARPRPERVVERAVGDTDGGPDRPDSDRGGPGCHGQRLDRVQNLVRLVDAWSGHPATITERLLYYSGASSTTSALGSASWAAA